MRAVELAYGKILACVVDVAVKYGASTWPNVVRAPSKRPLPETESLAPGVVVPIPTFPPDRIVIFVVPFVSNARLCASLVPSIAVAPNEFPPWRKKPEERLDVATVRVPPTFVRPFPRSEVK